MIAFYSLGSGLGHLSRTLKVIKALQVNSPVLLITNSHFCQGETEFFELTAQFKKQHISIHPICLTVELLTIHEQQKFLDQLILLLIKNKVRELFVDCFPVGIFGELNGMSEKLSTLPHYDLPLNLIARLIRWPNYQHLVQTSNHFNCTYYVEPLNELQNDYVMSNSASLIPLSLTYLSSDLEKDNGYLLNIADYFPNSQISQFCLVVHSGSEDETIQLLSYAKQKLRMNKLNYSIVLASPWPIPAELEDQSIVHINFYPLTNWLVNAEVIVSGGGYNLYHEIKALNKTAWFIPFERKYDDQFARLKK